MAVQLNDMNKKNPISKKILKCERYLRTVYPNFYRKISGYRNNGYISELEYYKIQTMAEVQGIIFDEILFVLHPFIGIKEVPVDPEPKIKPNAVIKRETESKYKRYSRRTSFVAS